MRDLGSDSACAKGMMIRRAAIADLEAVRRISAEALTSAYLAICGAKVRLYTNTRTERNIVLYRRHGFREVGTRPNSRRPGDMLVDMVKTLVSLSRDYAGSDDVS